MLIDRDGPKGTLDDGAIKLGALVLRQRRYKDVEAHGSAVGENEASLEHKMNVNVCHALFAEEGHCFIVGSDHCGMTECVRERR